MEGCPFVLDLEAAKDPQFAKVLMGAAWASGGAMEQWPVDFLSLMVLQNYHLFILYPNPKKVGLQSPFTSINYSYI